MKEMIYIIMLLLATTYVIVGIHHILYTLPLNIKRAADALEKIAENTKKERTYPPRRIQEQNITNPTEDGEEGSFLI